MSILKEQLLDEYARCIRNLYADQEALKLYPKGSLSNKKIGNRQYTYLQWRDGKTVHTKSLSPETAEYVQKILKQRDQLEESINNLREDISNLEKILPEKERKVYLEQYGRRYVNV